MREYILLLMVKRRVGIVVLSILLVILSYHTLITPVSTTRAILHKGNQPHPLFKIRAYTAAEKNLPEIDAKYLNKISIISSLMWLSHQKFTHNQKHATLVPPTCNCKTGPISCFCCILGTTLACFRHTVWCNM